MHKHTLTLLRFSAVFALIGAFLGSHMAGNGSYLFRPIHAHMLVVGWLTLFAWAVYYQVFTIKAKKISVWQVYTGIVGTIGLTSGMWLHNLKPFDISNTFTMVFYIVGGSILLISFLLFFITTFFVESPVHQKK